MSQPQNCIAVIPCHNESRGIGTLVARVRRFVSNVLVVDDGSTDGTCGTARQAGADVLVQDRRSGKGRSLQAGWRAAHAAGFDWAITMDGDGQHAAADIPAFFEKAQASGAPLVVGNRMTAPQGMPWLRRAVNRWLSRRISRLVGRDLPDTQCGFRLIHLPTLLPMPVEASHFEIESETLFQFGLRGFAIEFVPVEVIYAGEQSKIRPLLDSVRWIRWHIRAARIVSRARGTRPAQDFAAKSSTRVPCSIHAL